MTGTATPGQNQPKANASKPAEDIDDRPTPPVDDSDGLNSPQPDNDNPPPRPASANDNKKDGADNDNAPKMSPHDEARARIADRFAKKRVEDTSEFDGDLTSEANLYGKLGGKEPPASNDNDGKGGAPPDKLTLKVNGKALEKTVEEIAEQLEMTPDEVRANPAQAIKIAQKDLAATERLESAKKIQREQPPLSRENTGTRPELPPANQQDDDEPGKTPATKTATTEGNTSLDDEAAALVEQVQLEDPKVAGKKLAEFITKATSQAAKATVHETKASEALMNDRNTLATGLKEFGEKHPEVVETKEIQSAMIPALDAEYREDLVAALVAEGELEDAARELVASASADHVRNAHQRRRIAGDPNVRQMTGEFLETAYGRMKKNLGLSTPQQKPQQSFQEQRQQRKEKLPSQPQRASVPPATPVPPKAPMTRSSAVADMKRARGQKTLG